MSASAAVTRDLLLYMLWADRLTLAAVRDATPEDLTREAGISFKSLLGTLGHMVGVQRLWLARCCGDPVGSAQFFDQYPDLPSWIAAWEEMASQTEAFLAGLSDEQLATPLTWTSQLDGVSRTLPLWQGVVHLVNHTTYHRGQVVSLLRQMGYASPSTDLVYFFAERAATG